MDQVFGPSGNTVALDVDTTSAAAALTDIAIGASDREIRVYNGGNVTAFVAFGGASAAAVIPVDDTPASGMPVPAGAVEVLRVPSTVTHVAAITASGTTTLYVTTGRGA